MRKQSLHIRYSLILLLSLIITTLSAQDEDLDSVIEIPAQDYEVYEKEQAEFNEVNRFDVSSVDQRKVPDSLLRKYKSDNNFWYADYVKPQQKDESTNSKQNNKNTNWLRNIVWFIIVLSFVAVIIWFLISSNVQLFKGRSSAIATDHNEVLQQDIFEINYRDEIAKAKKADNYRLAIRLWYLQVLKHLSQQNIIQYKHEKTNSDYLMNLFGTAYYKDFFKLTRSFEYAWYGQFNVTQEAYEGIENDFENFNQRLF